MLTQRHSLVIALGMVSAFAVGRAIAQGQATVSPPPAANDGDCGAFLTPEDVAEIRANAEAGLYEGKVLTGFDFYYIPITMHVVRESDGGGGLSESRLFTALTDLNGEFGVSGMVFHRAGPTRYIDSDAFCFDIDTIEEINDLRQTDVIPGTVNMYFTENLSIDGDGLCGLSSFSSSSVQGIVYSNDCTGLSDNHSTVPHEVGHYFDLFHTHEIAFGLECVNGSNCDIAGDLVCDTPADPELSNKVDSDCDYTGSDRDTCENALYNPQTRNLMSYSRKECRNAFTSDQHIRVRATNENLRPELQSVRIANDAGTFVSGDFPDGGTGTPFFPYDIVSEGVQGALTGGCLIINTGDYPSALTIDKHVTLLPSRGPVRIGD